MTTRFYLTCIFLCVTCITKAQQPDWMVVADSLYAKEQYFEAGIFCERVLFEQQDEVVTARAILLEAACYKKQGQFDKAARFIAANQSRSVSDSLQKILYTELATCYYLAGDFDNCIAAADRSAILYGNTCGTRWMNLLKLLSLNEQQRWQEATALYRQQVPGDTLTDFYAHIPHLKSESKASWLATFIPGAGHFYAGKTWEGIASIVLQGAGVYYGIISWLDKYYVSAWLVGGGIAGSFHLGGVKRAAELVKMYNRKKTYEFNEKVKQSVMSRW